MSTNYQFTAEDYSGLVIFRRPVRPEHVAGLIVGGRDMSALGHLYQRRLDGVDILSADLNLTLAQDSQLPVDWSFLCTVRIGPSYTATALALGHR